MSATATRIFESGTGYLNRGGEGILVVEVKPFVGKEEFEHLFIRILSYV